MWKSTLYGIFIVISLCQIAVGQTKKAISRPADKYIIPFQLTEYNNLSVQAIVNEKDTVHLMFHTAANDVTLIEEAIKKMSSLHFDRVDSVSSWGGSGNAARFSKSNSLQIGELKWQEVPIWENKNSGQHTDGKFGTYLFANKVIEIDFDKKIIVLSNNLPAKTKRYEKLSLSVEDEMMFLEAGCKIGDSTFTNKFLIHSGYAGAVLFDDQFVAQNKIDEQLKIIDEKQLKDSYGNVLKTKKAILPAFTIGKQQLTNVPVSFFTGAIKRQKISIIGGDILRRFNIVIDAKREYVYLKANKSARIHYGGV